MAGEVLVLWDGHTGMASKRIYLRKTAAGFEVTWETGRGSRHPTEERRVFADRAEADAWVAELRARGDGWRDLTSLYGPRA
jgi:hypothetical protein